MRRVYTGKRLPFHNQRRDDHTLWIQCGCLFWDGFQFLDPRQHDWHTFARTYTTTGGKIALKALQKQHSGVILQPLSTAPPPPGL